MTTTWRALRVELLRGAAPVAALTTLVLGGLTVYSLAGDWAGRWMPFAASVPGRRAGSGADGSASCSAPPRARRGSRSSSAGRR
ncbi:MAG: hypothetical protein ACRDWI_02710 [Jiangellaceae bacterium]